MKIYSMTATYGKLEHETLTLEPGLNILEAPNEWGKSTWCSFLVAMLYGLETRVKSTKTALADKERYAPWSGSPMAGRIDLNWNGRDITIERKTKGRVPLGQFAAYETASGLPVQELTGANCGEMLLGVERSVFLRGGFIRLNDMPVTEDETLRRRLNALVTTGDESGDGDRLARALKDLKNRCRYNKSGLLPQAEAERAELEEKLRELEALEAQCGKLEERAAQVVEWGTQLENHKAHLKYRAAQADTLRVSQAQEAHRQACQRLAEAQAACADIPPRDRADQSLAQLRKLNQMGLDLQMEAGLLPQAPQEPEAPVPFQGMTGDEAVAKAKADGETYRALGKRKPLLLILGLVLVAAGAAAAIWALIPGVLCAVMGLIQAIGSIVMRRKERNQRKELETHYGSTDPDQWLAQAESWAQALRDAQAAREAYDAIGWDLDQRLRELREKVDEVTLGNGLETTHHYWERVLSLWDELAAAHREAQRTESYLQTLSSMAKSAEKPAYADTLNYTEPETARLLSDAAAELSQLRSRLGQYQGRMEALGDREALRADLDKVNARIEKLEDTYAALAIAQQTLADASLELQRRFAPKISRRAQELMAAFTAGRYDRLTLSEDLSLRAGAGEEDTLQSAIWRSDGTVDQLYLALRLAVAEALTPEAPLILDDALVRFDDTRLKAALDVLRQEAQKKQVILFTCQSREKALCE